MEVGIAAHVAGAPRLLDPLLVAEAAAEVAQLRRLRAVAAAAGTGRTQRDIAATLDISQSAVHKMPVRARHQGPAAADAWEIVLRYAARSLVAAQLEALTTRGQPQFEGGNHAALDDGDNPARTGPPLAYTTGPIGPLVPLW